VVVNLALGQPVDEEMTAWQAMFLPRRLMEYLRTARVAGVSGEAGYAGNAARMEGSRDRGRGQAQSVRRIEEREVMKL